MVKNLTTQYVGKTIALVSHRITLKVLSSILFPVILKIWILMN
ncbi:hypothetical protein PT100_08855 [Erysipelothrix rhusiopathiae]|nr:hypothetical protein [Erysipelothrix rhusiopathiae]